MQINAPALLSTNPTWLKFIVNEQAIAFSSPSLQHREISAPNVSYRDDGGNALAGIITNGRVEIRGHSVLGFSPERVKRLWQQVLTACGSDYLRFLPMHYQGDLLYTPPPRARGQDGR